MAPPLTTVSDIRKCEVRSGFHPKWIQPHKVPPIPPYPDYAGGFVTSRDAWRARHRWGIPEWGRASPWSANSQTTLSSSITWEWGRLHQVDWQCGGIWLAPNATYLCTAGEWSKFSGNRKQNRPSYLSFSWSQCSWEPRFYVWNQSRTFKPIPVLHWEFKKTLSPVQIFTKIVHYF